MAEKPLKTIKKPRPGVPTAEAVTAGLPSTPFDKGVIDKMIIDGIDAAGKMFARLQRQDFDQLSAGDTAHGLAFLTRALGQVLRDASFAAGGPDSRSDMRLAAEVERVFEKLTPEQLAQLREWRRKALDPTDPVSRG